MCSSWCGRLDDLMKLTVTREDSGMSPVGQMPPLAPSSTRPQSPYKHTHKTPSTPRGTTPTSEAACPGPPLGGTAGI